MKSVRQRGSCYVPLSFRWAPSAPSVVRGKKGGSPFSNLLPTERTILGESFNLSGLQFPYLQKGRKITIRQGFFLLFLFTFKIDEKNGRKLALKDEYVRCHLPSPVLWGRS